MATANTIDMAGRKPQVVSAMSNGIVWVGCALCVLLLGVVIVGFRTRILKSSIRRKSRSPKRPLTTPRKAIAHKFAGVLTLHL
jgi:hypothetical protein